MGGPKRYQGRKKGWQSGGQGHRGEGGTGNSKARPHLYPLLSAYSFEDSVDVHGVSLKILSQPRR